MVRNHDHTTSFAVTGVPSDHLTSLRRWSVTVLPLVSQLCASPGSGFRSGAGPSLRIGMLVLSTTSDEVVSVARPGSSDGGSLPIAIRSIPPEALFAGVPALVVSLLPLLPPPPQPAATRAMNRTATSPRGQANLGFRMGASWARSVSGIRMDRLSLISSPSCPSHNPHL